MLPHSGAKRHTQNISIVASDPLLHHLWRGGSFAHYWTSMGKQSLWFPTDRPLSVPTSWAQCNVHFSVHPCTQIPPTNSRHEVIHNTYIRSQIAYIAAINCLFADFDAKDFQGGKEAILAHLSTLTLYPSVIVDSGGGYHCYWLLEHTTAADHTNRPHLAAVQAAWVDLVGSDSGAKDLARILRLPGTKNVKPEYGPHFPTVAVIEANYKRLFRFVDFERLTEPLRQAKTTEEEAAAKKVATAKAQATPLMILDDQQLITKARNAANGVAFDRLWNGITSDYNNDHSRADMALCHHLAFWTDRDAARVDTLFRASGLMRDKWDIVHHSSGATYGAETIARAIAHTTEVYSPTPHNDQTPPDKTSTSETTIDSWAYQEELDADKDSALEQLLIKLTDVADSRPALMLFALDNASALAGLEAADFEKFCVQLRTRGLPAEWVRTDLRRAVTGEKKTQTSAPTWTDYIQAAHNLGYEFRLNDLSDTIEIHGQRMTDVCEATLLSLLHAQGLRNAEVARRAFLTEAGKNRYHPVKSYLQELQWDGQDTIARVATYFKDDHNPITYQDGTQRTVIHAWLLRWLVGAVAKVYDPTNAQNPMFILDGAQGSGKSYFAQWLCPLYGLHYEGPIRPEDKDFLGYLTTRWIWEVSELGATMRKADREALKAFITLQNVTYRAAYGRYPLQKPALASFIGTVNCEGALLSDPTGHRRFWPVRLTDLSWGYHQDVDVHQIWAQAYTLYCSGEPWRLTNEERTAHAEIVSLYEAEDVLEGYLRKYFKIEQENTALYTHTTDIIDTLRTYAGPKGTDKGLSMQLSITLNHLGLNKAKRDNRWGYIGIAKSIG